MPHFLRRSKIPLAIATGVILSAGALFLGAGSSHHYSGVYCDGEFAYVCSQQGHGSYTWYSNNNCCDCN